MTNLCIFDLDNTLIDTRTGARSAYEQLFTKLSQETQIDQRILYASWKDIVNEIGGSHIPFERDLRFSLQKLFEQQHIEEDVLPYITYFQETLGGHIKIMEGALAVIEALSQKNSALAVSTESSTELAVLKLAATGLLEKIDFLCTSDIVGTMKPDADYFSIPMEHFSASPRETIAIGDNYKKDVEIPRNMGCRAIHFQNVTDFAPLFEL